MKTIEKLKNHTYLNKQGNPIKNPKINHEQVLEAYSYLIHLTKGSLSTRLLRLTFTDKAKTFTQILEDTGYIQLVKPTNTIKIKFEDGTTQYVSTPNKYSSIRTIRNIEENRYIKSLWKKLDSRKDEYQWLLDSMSETLSKTTLDGESIGTDIKYKKGRYYGPHTNIKKEERKNLRIDGKRTLSYDIMSSVFQLLSINKIEGIEPITFEELDDIKLKLQITKCELIKQIFCNPYLQDVRLDKWPFFKSLKSFKYDNGHKMVYYLYQKCETTLMNNIYETLTLNKISYLPLHDCVIIKETDYGVMSDIIREITNVKFKIER